MTTICIIILANKSNDCVQAERTNIMSEARGICKSCKGNGKIAPFLGNSFCSMFQDILNKDFENRDPLIINLSLRWNSFVKFFQNTQIGFFFQMG